MFTLENFYKSHEWQRFREIVIAERRTPDGFVKDEITGRPIVKKYDIVLHHKIFLTEENVNDLNISLNPENIQIVSQLTHNRVHDRYGQTRKEIWLVYGPPLAGKRTYVEGITQPGDLVVNLDNIWECITGKDRYTKPPRLNAVAFAVRDLLLDCVRTRRGRWANAYIVGGFPLIGERERFIKETGAREIYVDTKKETCLERAASLENQTARATWREYIEKWFDQYDAGSGTDA